MNSLNKVHGASTEEQTCVISPLTAASSTDPNGSQHQNIDKATEATETSTSSPGRWRRARAKRVREERTEKAIWEQQFEEKLYKMAKESVERQLHDVKHPPRTAFPSLPAVVPKINSAESMNPAKRACKLRIHGEDHNSTFSPNGSDDNLWANLPVWTSPPAAPVENVFVPPPPKELRQPPQPSPTKASPPTKVPPPKKAPPSIKAHYHQSTSSRTTRTRSTSLRHLLRPPGDQHHHHHQGPFSTPKLAK